MQKITPFLWFDGKAEEAANFYASIFSSVGARLPDGQGSASGGRNSKVGSITRYDEAGAKASGMPKGTAMTVSFQLEGQGFTALNGGPHFKFTEAISFVVNCESQEEVDHYWAKLSEGGDEKAQQCGWLKDKYGLSWQIIPYVLAEMLRDKDAEKSKRVMQAMLKMDKIDIKTLKQAYEPA
jgi:predicted 3-demethylubiquinone-9 3-methyltransferase (glyoxalase superfamily)